MAEKAGTTKDKAAAVSTKKKRTILSPAERAARLREEAAMLDAKVKDQAKAKLGEAEARVTQLTEQRDKVQLKLDAAAKVVSDLKVAAQIEDEAPATS